jgi:hypothetical protein
MLNIIRNIKRLNLLRAAAMCIALALVIAPGKTHSQSLGSNYTARGIAPVSDGNISAARTTALTDAQQKAVLTALADQMSLEKLSSSFATLHNLFISRPDVYVQRFKILNETTLSGNYHILIEAFIEDELMRNDLESIGINGPVQQKMKVLLMVAETASDKEYSGWWAADPAERILPVDVGEQMAFSFRERGVGVIDDGTIPFEPLAPNEDELFPGHEAVLRVARQAGADIVVLAKASIKQTAAQPGASITQMQCDMSAEVLDVHMRELVLQTATNSLGMHSDQDAAARDAAAKASSRIVEHILDRMLPAISGRHIYALRCTFPGTRPESYAQDFFSLLRAALPEIVRIDVRDTTDANVRQADIVSSVDGTTLMQKALRTELGGYKLTLGTVEDTVINLTVTPPETP